MKLIDEEALQQCILGGRLESLQVFGQRKYENSQKKMLRIKTDSSSSDNDVRSLLLFQNTLLQILSISLAINSQLWKTAFITLIFHLAILWKWTSITLCAETILTIPKGRQAGEIWLFSFRVDQKTKSYFNDKILWLLYISFGRKHSFYSPPKKEKKKHQKQINKKDNNLRSCRNTDTPPR